MCGHPSYADTVRGTARDMGVAMLARGVWRRGLGAISIPSAGGGSLPTRSPTVLVRRADRARVLGAPRAGLRPVDVLQFGKQPGLDELQTRLARLHPV